MVKVEDDKTDDIFGGEDSLHFDLFGPLRFANLWVPHKNFGNYAVRMDNANWDSPILNMVQTNRSTGDMTSLIASTAPRLTERSGRYAELVALRARLEVRNIRPDFIWKDVPALVKGVILREPIRNPWGDSFRPARLLGVVFDIENLLKREAEI